eukprot:scaffold114603_cov51-Phaeocystis_antarctica.AAC.1
MELQARTPSSHSTHTVWTRARTRVKYKKVHLLPPRARGIPARSGSRSLRGCGGSRARATLALSALASATGFARRPCYRPLVDVDLLAVDLALRVGGVPVHGLGVRALALGEPDACLFQEVLLDLLRVRDECRRCLGLALELHLVKVRVRRRRRGRGRARARARARARVGLALELHLELDHGLGRSIGRRGRRARFETAALQLNVDLLLDAAAAAQPAAATSAAQPAAALWLRLHLHLEGSSVERYVILVRVAAAAAAIICVVVVVVAALPRLAARRLGARHLEPLLLLNLLALERLPHRVSQTTREATSVGVARSCRVRSLTARDLAACALALELLVRHDVRHRKGCDPVERSGEGEGG